MLQYRDFQSVLSISGQRWPTDGTENVSYITCSQRHLLAAIENKWLEAPIEKQNFNLER